MTTRPTQRHVLEEFNDKCSVTSIHLYHSHPMYIEIYRWLLASHLPFHDSPRKSFPLSSCQFHEPGEVESLSDLRYRKSLVDGVPSPSKRPICGLISILRPTCQPN